MDHGEISRLVTYYKTLDVRKVKEILLRLGLSELRNI